MTNRILTLLMLLLLVVSTMACNGSLAQGNMAGVVVRETSGDLIVHPYLIVGRTHKSPLVPDLQFTGDNLGRFELSLAAGNYTVQFGTSSAGPLYTWPQTINVEENKTTIVLLKLPDGF